MQALETINVVEVVDGTIISLVSFSTDRDSIETAENMFAQKIKENMGNGSYSEDDKEQLEDYVDNGYFENDNYQIFLRWSDPVICIESA
jgi:hypothetical protein